MAIHIAIKEIVDGSKMLIGCRVKIETVSIHVSRSWHCLHICVANATCQNSALIWTLYWSRQRCISYTIKTRSRELHDKAYWIFAPRIGRSCWSDRVWCRQLREPAADQTASLWQSRHNATTPLLQSNYYVRLSSDRRFGDFSINLYDWLFIASLRSQPVFL